MGRMVGVREEFQIGLGAESIRQGGNRFYFRDPYTGKIARGLMSVLEWNVALDKWVQVEPPQGDRPGSQFTAWVNKQLEVVWQLPIGRYRTPAPPSKAAIAAATIAPAPAPAPAPVAPTAPPPAPAPARAVLPTAEITTAQAPSFPAATTATVLPTNGVSAPAGFAMPDLPMWAWIAIAGGAVYLFTRK